MSDIFNLDALCRCCHADGIFKPLQGSYVVGNGVENYVNMLLETLGVIIQPPRSNESYAICDDCITELRNASQFKKKVLDCEAKFEEYCKNEHSNLDVKIEPEYLDDNLFDDDDKYLADCTQEYSDKKPDKRIKNEEIKEVKESIEICIDVKPKLEEKPAKKKSKPVKGKTKRKIREEALAMKVKTETGELYSCRNCGVTYENLDELNRHINEEHGKGLKCGYCDEILTSEREFNIHYKNKHNDPKPWSCEHCSKKMSSKGSLLEHISTVHTKDKYFQCDICQKTFHSKSVLKIHLQKHAGTFKKLICEQCGVKCNDSTNLRMHIMVVHQKLKLFKCTECDKSFSASKHLKIHLRRHTGELPFECDVCLLAFVSSDSLKAHKKQHMDNSYKCRTCGELFQTRGQYAKHYRGHLTTVTMVKPYKCHLCNKEFAGRYSLNRHVFGHTGERPFVCSICNKTFAQKPLLVRHAHRFHNPNKPPVVKEKCHICNRTVPFLQKHLQAHENKPFDCHLCDKKYPMQNALNRHIQSRHAGIKPHKCDLCDKAFIQQKSLKNHKLKVHKLPLKTEQEDHYDSLVTTYTIQNLKRKPI